MDTPARLDRITIRGFRSIRALENFELKNLNVLIGANGAGKSNLISFFRLLRSLMENDLDGYIRESGGVGDLLFRGRKTTRRMHFETRFGPRGHRFDIEETPRKYALTHEARYFEPGQHDWWELGDSPDGRSRLVEEVESDPEGQGRYSLPVCQAVRAWTIYHFHDTSATAGMRHDEIVEDNERLRRDGRNVAPFLLRLRTSAPSAYREILEACRLVVPYLDDFLLQPERFGPKVKVRLSWRARGSDYPMQPHQLSDGSIRFVCLAAALLQPNPPSAIVVDEPELGLHPAAIHILGELVQSASRKARVIAATQSPLFVDCFSIDDIVVVSLRNGESRFERLDERDFQKWLEEYSTGELWTKNVISGGPVYG